MFGESQSRCLQQSFSIPAAERLSLGSALYLAARCLVRAAVAGGKTRSSAADLAEMLVLGGDASAASTLFPQGCKNASFTGSETLA